MPTKLHRDQLESTLVPWIILDPATRGKPEIDALDGSHHRHSNVPCVSRFRGTQNVSSWLGIAMFTGGSPRPGLYRLQISECGRAASVPLSDVRGRNQRRGLHAGGKCQAEQEEEGMRFRSRIPISQERYPGACRDRRPGRVQRGGYRGPIRPAA